MERNERLGRCVDESEGWMAKEKRKTEMMKQRGGASEDDG